MLFCFLGVFFFLIGLRALPKDLVVLEVECHFFGKCLLKLFGEWRSSVALVLLLVVVLVLVFH